MINFIFRIYTSLILAILAGVIFFIPGLIIGSIIYEITKDPIHPGMPIGAFMLSALTAIIGFLIVLYKAYRYNDKLIMYFKSKLSWIK